MYFINFLTILLNVFTAYIVILLWIDMNLLEVKSSIHEHNTNTNVSSSKSELIDYSIEPGNMINYY